MNKKAFTVVELIVTFALTMAIAVFLFQIIIVLKNIYVSYGTRTELLNKQSLISYQINKSLNSKQLVSVSKCGSYCLNFTFLDGTTERLLVDTDNRIFEYGSYKTTLPKDSYFGDMKIDVSISPTFNSEKNDSLITINIPIFNSILKDEDFGVRTIYQYNSALTNITKIVFDDKVNTYGSVLLKGTNEIEVNNDVIFNDPGYVIYDKDGNITTDNLVVVENPLASMTLPYKAGKYEIKYKLKNSNGDFVYTISRFVNMVVHYYATYDGPEKTNIALNTNYNPEKCKLRSSYGDIVQITDLPQEYAYTEVNNLNIAKLGNYIYSCTLYKNGKTVNSFTNYIYVK